MQNSSKKIIALLGPTNTGKTHDAIEKIAQNPLTPFEYNRRKTTQTLNIGGKNVPIVMADFCGKETIRLHQYYDKLRRVYNLRSKTL